MQLFRTIIIIIIICNLAFSFAFFVRSSTFNQLTENWRHDNSVKINLIILVANFPLPLNQISLLNTPQLMGTLCQNLTAVFSKLERVANMIVNKNL